VYEIETRRLLGTERKRSWVGPRRCWCMRRESGGDQSESSGGMPPSRDASMISRLHTAYAETRDKNSESARSAGYGLSNNSCLTPLG